MTTNIFDYYFIEIKSVKINKLSYVSFTNQYNNHLIVINYYHVPM